MPITASRAEPTCPGLSAPASLSHRMLSAPSQARGSAQQGSKGFLEAGSEWSISKYLKSLPLYVPSCTGHRSVLRRVDQETFPGNRLYCWRPLPAYPKAPCQCQPGLADNPACTSPRGSLSSPAPLHWVGRFSAGLCPACRPLGSWPGQCGTRLLRDEE